MRASHLSKSSNPAWTFEELEPVSLWIALHTLISPSYIQNRRLSPEFIDGILACFDTHGHRKEKSTDTTEEDRSFERLMAELDLSADPSSPPTVAQARNSSSLLLINDLTFHQSLISILLIYCIRYSCWIPSSPPKTRRWGYASWSYILRRCQRDPPLGSKCKKLPMW